MYITKKYNFLFYFETDVMFSDTKIQNELVTNLEHNASANTDYRHKSFDDDSSQINKIYSMLL